MTDTALDLIKKLLRLSQSPNAHEAALAMEKAFALAAKHQIDLDSVSLDDDERRIVYEATREGARLSHSKKMAMGITATFFNVTPLLCRPHVKWIGTASDVTIAIYVYGYLWRTCDRCALEWKHAAGRRWTANRHRNFVAGFSYGVSSRLRKQTEELSLSPAAYGLVLAREEARRDSYLHDLAPDTKSVTLALKYRRDPGALMRGYEKGRQTEIHHSVGGSAVAAAQIGERT